MIRRRDVVAGLSASFALGPFAARAEPVTIKMGSLKLIHCITPQFYQKFAPPGVTVEVVPFETPADCMTAVATKSVDFGTFGIAAATLGAVNGLPIVVVASMSNRGMAIIARKGSGIASIKDLKGKRVGILPGSTQEVFARERLHMEGMSIKDIQPIRLSFSEMHAALARGDIDAYVGAEPGPGVSLSTGVGTLVEYPYGTDMGSMNMIIATHRDMIEQKPDVVRILLDIHRNASMFVAKNPDAVIAMAAAKLGQKKEALEISLPNVEYKWRLGAAEVKQANSYAGHMLDLKQIKHLPDASLIDTKFADAMSAAER
jgi:ABC-type nitrate/sulfonate/bicarbonate transport system substrate-binding protein